MSDALPPSDSIELLTAKLESIRRMLFTLSDQMSDLSSRIEELKYNWDYGNPPYSSED